MVVVAPSRPTCSGEGDEADEAGAVSGLWCMADIPRHHRRVFRPAGDNLLCTLGATNQGLRWRARLCKPRRDLLERLSRRVRETSLAAPRVLHVVD